MNNMPLQKYKYNRKTYFVDYRLKEFRSDTYMIEFVPFQSEKGDLILCKMIKEKLLDLTKYDI
jgi:hypothetical protein